MDSQLLFSSIGSQSHMSVSEQALDHLIPYAILIINYIIFQLMRSLVDKLLVSCYLQLSGSQSSSNNVANVDAGVGVGKLRLLKLMLHELISTCELCADCAELNVVYEKHGTYAYGVSLFLLTYLWMESFGEALTSPGYLVEDYFLVQGNQLLKTGDAYARFIGQSMAMPLAWRLATWYWKYELIREHRSMPMGTGANTDCKSSLTTSTLNGFLIELSCSGICRLAELIGHKLLERQYLSQRVVSVTCSFLCSLLVVLALELSGGYFNPILAASLEYGCKGIELHQHALVFWLGPMLGHLLARVIFRRYDKSAGQRQVSTGDSGRQRTEIDRFKQSIVTRRQQGQQARGQQVVSFSVAKPAGGGGRNDIDNGQQMRRQTRSGSGQRRRKSSDKID